MKKINNHITIIALILSSLIISCEKIVHLDLNSAEPRIVIEGNITSEPGPYLVSITTSGDYYTAEGMEQISGASVIVTDDFGNIDTLTEINDGNYYTNNTVGMSNSSYSLKVDYQGVNYSGSDFLPNKVLIDSLNYEKRDDGGHGPGNGKKPMYDFFCFFTDPPETVDYYRFRIKVNGIPIGGSRNYYSLRSDQLINGQHVKQSLRRIEAMPGDSITIELNSIGFNTYEYYRTLNDALNSGGMGSTPYNPISNLSNKALGYFGAYTKDSQSLIIQE